jgi:hypothetical protein
VVDSAANADGKFGKPLPPFKWLIENGKVCVLNFPIALNPGMARALSVMMKLDFQRAVLPLARYGEEPQKAFP